VTVRAASYYLQWFAVSLLLYAAVVGTALLWVDPRYPVVRTNGAAIHAETVAPGRQLVVLHDVEKPRDCPGTMHADLYCRDHGYRHFLFSRHDSIDEAFSRLAIRYDIPPDAPVGACEIRIEFASVCWLRQIRSYLQPVRFRIERQPPAVDP